jgi:hypothetical protein
VSNLGARFWGQERAPRGACAGLERPGHALIWPRKQGVRRLAAITVRRMARGTLDTPVRVQRAAKGDRFYTWRGRVRQLFPVDGRLVLNAYLGGELVGSAIVSSHEADEDEQRETAWTLADARFSPSGPYFGDPDLFAEPCDLHFESLYTWRDVRRRGRGGSLDRSRLGDRASDLRRVQGEVVAGRVRALASDGGESRRDLVLDSGRCRRVAWGRALTSSTS